MTTLAAAVLLSALAGGVGLRAEMTVTYDKSANQNIVVGHYGETFSAPGGWKVNYSMLGDSEFIWMHENRRKGPGGGYELNRPTLKDFEYLNYTPMRLASIQVIPRASSKKFSTLEEARKDQERFIRETFKGEEDVMIFDPHMSIGFWPPGSFAIRMRKPYELLKIYTQSKEYFYILTGAHSDNDGPLSSDVQWTFHSLASHLYEDNPRPVPEPDPFPLSKQVVMVFPIALVWIGAFLLGALPADRFGRLVFIGKSIVSFSWIWGGAGFATALICVRLAGVDVYGASVFVFPPVFFMPWILRRASERLGGLHPQRVFWVMVILIPFLLYWAVIFQYFLMAELVQVPEDALYISIWLGIIYGVFFGLTVSPLAENLGWRALWTRLRGPD